MPSLPDDALISRGNLSVSQRAGAFIHLQDNPERLDQEPLSQVKRPKLTSEWLVIRLESGQIWSLIHSTNMDSVLTRCHAQSRVQGQ